jgi:hypothetical protein
MVANYIGISADPALFQTQLNAYIAKAKSLGRMPDNLCKKLTTDQAMLQV